MRFPAVDRFFSPARQRRRIHWRWLRAAAVAGVVLGAGAGSAESAPINCLSQSLQGCSGTYTNGTEQSNIWKFYTDSSLSDLLYTLEIRGIPLSDFTLSVSDLVLTQAEIVDRQLTVNFPGAVCIPTFDQTRCGLFAVFQQVAQATWANGYLLTITWFANANPLSQPPDDGLNTILQAHDPVFRFDNELAAIDYDPSPTPTDPGISGRGDSFSLFGAFRRQSATVPEPASLLLVGTALAGTLYRVRRRR